MHNYSSGYKLLAAAFILAALGILISLFFTSCNPVKKAYAGIAKYEPETAKDSTNFYKRAKTLIHPPKPSVQPGHTIRVPYPVEKLKKVIDTVALQHITDSLEIAHASDLNDAVDDCIASVKQARKEGVQAGYDRANYENYINGKEYNTPDTFYIPDSSLVIELNNSRVELMTAHDEVIRLRTSDQIHNSAAKSRLWIIILLSSGLLLSIYLHFRKSTSVTGIFNKIKNTI